MMPISDRSEPYPSMLAFSGYATYSALSFAEKLSQLVKNFPNAVCWREKRKEMVKILCDMDSTSCFFSTLD